MRTGGAFVGLPRRPGGPAIVLVVLEFVLVGLVLALPAGPVRGSPAAAGESSPTVVLFHGEGCPHCVAERAWLQELAIEYPGLRIEQYEVWNDESNRQVLRQYADELGFEPSGVPVTIVADQVWIGFSDTVVAEIESVVAAASADSGAPTQIEPTPASTVDVPLLGTVTLTGSSLVVSTALIGFADGINPCSLWVLAVLLAIVLHSGSRGRVLLVGSTFLLVTAAMYGLYIAGMYSALDYVSGLTWIRAAVALVALALGALQLKDGIAPGIGPSLSISPSRRPRLYRTMRGVSRTDRGLLPTLAGTAALAVGVSLLETPCTAGLPLMWTSMLADQEVVTAAAIALFGIYMAVFLLDELVLFGVAVVTMRATHVQRGQGQALKIISGSLLITLATVMLLAPTAMTQAGTSLLVFAVAGVLALVVWLVARGRHPVTPHHRGSGSDPGRLRSG